MYMGKFQKTASLLIALAFVGTSVVWAKPLDGSQLYAAKKEKEKTEEKQAQEKDVGKKEVKNSVMKIHVSGDGLEIELEDNDELDADAAKELKDAKKSVTESVYDRKSTEHADGLKKLISKLEASDKLSEKDLIKLSLSYKTLGDYEKALDYANKALAAEPDSQKPLILLAQIYKAMNEPEKAMELLKTVLSANQDAKIKAFMAILKEDNGDLEDSKALLEEAVKDENKELELYRKLGEIKEKLGEHGLKVYVKGKIPNFDVKPTIVNDRTVVPISAVSQALGATVEYIEATRTVIITKGTTRIELPIGVDEALVNGKAYALETPALILDDRTMVPLRFVSEALNTDVVWQGDTQSVIINEK